MTSSAASNLQRSFSATKIYPPRIPKIIKRQSCLRTLSEAAGHKIMFISGRAGQGKTTLTLSWLKEAKIKPVWVTLDLGDNDPITLFRLLADAFSHAFPRTEFNLPTIPTGAPFDAAVFARNYLRYLLSPVSGRYAIVFDDFHLLDEGGPLPALIEVLVEALPPKVPLMLLSRHHPPAFLAKWIANRQLFSISEEFLRFSPQEVESLFRELFGKQLDLSEAEFLQGKLEGWVTGLILLYENIKGAGGGISSKRLLQTRVGDRIFDYLYHEVYRRLHPDLQSTMMRLALLPSFSIETARRLICSADVAAQIRMLLAQHLLSKTATGDQIQFRFHPLLRDFLREQVRALPQAEYDILVDQVGLLQEEMGAVDEAITLYLDCSRFERAILLIERFGLSYLLEGKRHLLRRWMRSLPQQQLKENPWLLYFLASDQAFSDPAEAAASFGRAISGFEKGSDIEGQLWARASRMMSAVYAGADFRSIQADRKWAEPILQAQQGSPLARASFLLAEAFSGLAASDYPQHALHKALAAAELARQAGSLPLSARALIRAAFSAGYLGKHRMAASLFEESEAIFPWGRLDPPLRAEALLYRGIVETFRGERQLSRQLLLQARQICQDFGLNGQIPLLEAYLIWNRVTLGEEEGSDPSLEPVRRKMLAGGNYYYAAAISHSQAMICLEEGDLKGALRREEESLQLLKRCHTRFLMLVPLAVLGAIWGKLGEHGKAEKYLRRALSGFGRAGSEMFRFMALLHLAKVALGRADEEEAKRKLAAALCCGKTEQYLVGEGIRPTMMRDLISRARRWNLAPGYLDALINFWQVRPEPLLKIRTLGAFEATLGGRPIPEEAWHGRKAQLLLHALLSLGGREAQKEEIMDLLWPEADGDRAVTSFYTTLHRLQSVFGPLGKENAFIRLSMGRLSLNATCCWSDVGAFEEAIRKARRAEAAGRWSEMQESLQEARALYQGEYLPGFLSQPWIAGKRETLEKQFEWVSQRLQSLRQEPGRR